MILVLVTMCEANHNLCSDASGAEKKDVSLLSDMKPAQADADVGNQVDDTATAILKKKKKPNSLM